MKPRRAEGRRRVKGREEEGSEEGREEGREARVKAGKGIERGSPEVQETRGVD